jgi:hypothetical protein
VLTGVTPASSFEFYGTFQAIVTVLDRHCANMLNVHSA